MQVPIRVPTRLAASGVALALASTLGAPVRAVATDPPFVGWTAVMPGFAFNYDPSSANACVAGRRSCVTKTIRQMGARFDPLMSSCDHDAVYSLAYLRTTEAYLEATDTEGFFREPALVNHEDAAFAQMYFHADDDWAAGRIEQVPPAWRVAFSAADTRQVSGSGDLLLGMNAHVNRDLPFVLYATGLVDPDGHTRKGDHDQINVMLNHVVEPLVTEEAARFDPGIATMKTPYKVGSTGLMQTLLVWREQAWRQAEALAEAPDAPARRQVVAREIETYARANAEAIVAAEAYAPPATTTAARESYCAMHGFPED